MNFTVSVSPKYLHVSPRLQGELFHKVAKSLSYRVHNYKMTDAYKKYGWDGYRRLFNRYNKAPSGCYRRLCNLLKKEGHQVIVKFTRNYRPTGDGKIHSIKKLERFQVESPELAIKHRFCIIEAVVRSGKTAILAKIINTINHYPVVVLTKNETDVTMQIKREIEKCTGREVGLLSEGKYIENDIVVSNYQALSVALKKTKRKMSEKTKLRNDKLRALVKDTKVLLLDECHHAIAPTYEKMIEKFSSIGYKVGVSGTPHPDNVPHLAMEAAIGPVVKKVQFDTVIKSGRIAQPLVIVYDLPRSWYDQYVDGYNDIYEKNVVNNIMRNRFIAETAKKLRESGKNCFIAVSKIDHGLDLRSRIPDSFFVRGSTETETRTSVYKSLQDKKIHCVVSTVGKEALDIPKLDAIINAEGFQSHVATIQRMRSLTASAGKEYGIVIDFRDKETRFLTPNSLKRIEEYESIKGFIVKHRIVPSDYFERTGR